MAFFLSLLVSLNLYAAPSMEQLTTLGKNRQPLIVDGQGILYISRDRKDHKDPQIYFKSFLTGEEKRLTFQRGHIINGLWLNKDQKIVYASSTDEEKETPFALRKYIRYPASIDTHFFFHLSLKPTESYTSQVDGTNVKRISKHSGFDAFPAYIESKDKLLFSRLEKGKINIFSRPLKAAKRHSGKKLIDTQGHDLGLQLSPTQNHLVWYRFSPDFKGSQLMMSKNDFKDLKMLTADDGISWSPTWHPSEETIFYSARRGQDKSFNLYEVSVKKGCQRKITSLPGDEFYPTVSTDGLSILFTATKSGSEQIHKMPYPTPFECEIY